MASPQSLPADFTPGPGLLRGRNLLLTGAHTDVGHTIALGLASHGANLLLITRKERLLADLYDQLVDAAMPEPLLIALDLDQAEEAHYDQLAAQLGGEVESLHGLITMDLPAAPLAPMSLTQQVTWETCLRKMLLQPMQLVRAMLPLLQRAENPAVVFQTLPCGRQGKPYWAPLGGALAGLENLNQTLAVEHADIQFNTLDIGPVDSDLRRRFYPGEARSQLKPVTDPSVISAFLYLCSGVGEGVSGQAFEIP